MAVLAIVVRTPAAPLLLLFGLLGLACGQSAPELRPRSIHESEWSTRELLVHNLEPSFFSEVTSNGLRSAPGLEVWIGDVRADVERVDAEGVWVRLSEPLPVATHGLRVVRGGQERTRHDALQVYSGLPPLSDGGVPDGAIFDGGPMPDAASPMDGGRSDDAGRAPDGGDAASPMDAAPDDAGRTPGAGDGAVRDGAMDAGPMDAGPMDAGPLIDAGMPGSPRVLAAGKSATHELREDGTIWSWGLNAYGELGVGDTIERSTPVRTGIRSTWQTIAAGNEYACAIAADSGLWCWGNNDVGQLGLGDTIPRDLPTLVDTGFRSLAMHSNHVCAIRTDGALMCWGSNARFRLGLGDEVDRHVPTRVGSRTDWASVSVGTGDTVARRGDGTLWGWGQTFGPTRSQVGTANDWVDIEVGSNSFQCGRRGAGTLWCWGNNNRGQLGLGDAIDRADPTRVGARSDWTDITLGKTHACGRTADGAIHCWGDNRRAQLGLGDTAVRHSPVQVGSATDWRLLEAGDEHTCGTNGAGNLYCWGDNRNLQLGLGDRTNRLVPTLVH